MQHRNEIFEFEYPISVWWIFNIEYQSGGYLIFKCENLIEWDSNSMKKQILI